MRFILIGLLFLAGCQSVEYTEKKEPVVEKGKTAQGDYYNIRKNGQVLEGRVITDLSSSGAAHRDAIQLIPSSPKHGRWQYMGGMISDVTIKNNVIISPAAKLQGIFSSDGLISNVTVTNNFIKTQSAHKITLSGVLSGSFKGNEALIQLYPLRLGGGLLGETFIMSFKNNKYKYGKVTVDNEKFLKDLRFVKKKGAVYLYNFDLDAFQLEAVKLKDRDITAFITKLKALALKFGVQQN